MDSPILLLGLAQLASVAIWIALILAVLVGVPYFLLFGGAERFCRKPMLHRYHGLEIHDYPQLNDVQFIYHTYRGFLLWFVQDPHHISAPPNDAKTLLARLLRFNLTFGMLSYGLVFVPFLAIGNYFVERRSINKQITKTESATKNAE